MASLFKNTLKNKNNKNNKNNTKRNRDFEEYVTTIHNKDVVVIKALELTRFNKEIINNLLKGYKTSHYASIKISITHVFHLFFNLINDESIKGKLMSYNDNLLLRYLRRKSRNISRKSRNISRKNEIREYIELNKIVDKIYEIIHDLQSVFPPSKLKKSLTNLREEMINKYFDGNEKIFINGINNITFEGKTSNIGVINNYFREDMKGMIKSPVIIGRINKNHVSMNTEYWQELKSEIIRNINNIDELKSNLQSINDRDISKSEIEVVKELLEGRIKYLTSISRSRSRSRSPSPSLSASRPKSVTRRKN